jgi:L-methionine (R)-S-oxide reductase
MIEPDTMAETVKDLHGLSKKEAWAVLLEETAAVLEGVHDEVAAMATVSSLVHHGFDYLWTGFYRVVTPGKLLRVGPYQGTLGCLEIAFGKGVCGAAAADERTLIVPDVRAFPGHIACDGRSLSEIVAPVFDRQGALIAVFDIDSERLGAFDEEDRAGVEKLLAWFAR